MQIVRWHYVTPHVVDSILTFVFEHKLWRCIWYIAYSNQPLSTMLCYMLRYNQIGSNICVPVFHKESLRRPQMKSTRLVTRFVVRKSCVSVLNYSFSYRGWYEYMLVVCIIHLICELLNKNKIIVIINQTHHWESDICTWSLLSIFFLSSHDIILVMLGKCCRLVTLSSVVIYFSL